jgi:PPP family 3-phenylpropionic acid transporter
VFPLSINFRLSFYFFSYFAAIGVFLPYWTVYLKEIKGFEAAEIGELMAVYMLTKMVAPIIWGSLADSYNNLSVMVRIACVMTLLCFSASYASDSYLGIMVVMACFGFFWTAALSPFEALTLNHLGDQTDRYSRIRLWGSIGFVVTVLTLPFLIESQGLPLVLDALVFLFLVIILAAFLVPNKNQPIETVNTSRIWDVLRKPAVIVLLVACAMNIASHGTYYTFFTIYMNDHGYSEVFIGWMWALGVIGEVVLFASMHLLMKRCSAAQLFVFAMYLTALRWFLLGAFIDSISILIFAQLLHAATFGLYHASAIHLIHGYFPGRLQARGQALYSGLSMGFGGAIGGLLSGYAWDSIGNEVTFYVSGVVALIAAIMAWVWIR